MSKRIAFLGGSITKGEMVKKEESFLSLLEKRWKEEKQDIQIINRGESGTMSSNGIYKVPEIIEQKPDLLFLDYAMNDTGDRFLAECVEGMVSTLLREGIAVVILFFCNDQGLCTRGAMERIAAHYQIPIWDIGAKVIEKLQDGSLTWEEYGQDYVHPTPYGHQLIARYIGELYQNYEWQEKETIKKVPKEPAFLGALRKYEILELAENMKDAKPGQIVFQEKLSYKMLLLEFRQNSIPNPANMMISIDGTMVESAEAFANFAWGNPVAKYINGGDSLQEHEVTITLGKEKPPVDWDYRMFQCKLLLGTEL